MALREVELLQTVCPCGCRAPVLVAADRVGAGVTCPATRRRLTVPAGGPLTLRFGRKQWDGCRDVRLLRQALALTAPRLAARRKRLAALTVADVCLDWCRSPVFHEARAAAWELAETGVTSRDCQALGDALAPGSRLRDGLAAWRLVGLRMIQSDPDLTYGPLEMVDPLRVAVAVKDAIANPFRVAVFDPAWRTESVVQLAEAIHARQTLVDLPILADALEEAGCRDWPALAHLRGPGRHGPGCWVLDWTRGRLH